MKPLLVFGSINLDISLRVPRLPLPGETLMGSRLKLSPGGKGANQAHAARLQGADVHLVGAVGHDAFADAALARLDLAGVNTRGVRGLPGSATGMATIHVTEEGENAIVVIAGANAEVRADWVTDEQLDACALLLLQGELPLVQSMALARRHKARGGQVMLNLAPVCRLSKAEVADIDWLVLNQTELADLCRLSGIEGSSQQPGCPAQTAAWLARCWHCHVVLTLGAAGAVACLREGERFAVPALQIAVVDSTGAGDTFCGVLAAALNAGSPPALALRRASVAGGLACSAPGAQASQPTRHEIDQHLARL